MALRVEHILILAIGVTLFFVLKTEPKGSIKVAQSNSTKEFYFKDFILLELNSTGIKNSLKAKEATKYKDTFILKDIELNYENEDRVFAKSAVYIKDSIYLKDNVVFEEIGNFKFWSSDLNYNIKSKNIYTSSNFKLKIRDSSIVGKGLKYNMRDKEIEASNIDANVSY
jgi:LPS export ABC transporter protein LptC